MAGRALVLGGAGWMGREVVRDLAATSDFDEIIVADRDLVAATQLVDELHNKRFRAVAVDVTNANQVDELLRRIDVIANCTTYHHGLDLVRSAIRLRRPYVDLGGLFNTPRQLEFGPEAKSGEVPIVLGCGATPGVTNLMAQAASAGMDSIERVEIAFGSLRPLAASPGLLDTILEEFSPTTSRFYYEDGQFVQVPPFSGARVLEFLPPVGALETYLVPHSETHTLPRFLTPQPHHVSVRGSWHPDIMRAMRIFLDYGLTGEEPFTVDGTALTPRAFLRAHLLHRPPALDSPVAFFLRVDVTGAKAGDRLTVSYQSSHPTDWGSSGTARMTGIPTSIALQALARGDVARVGVLGPEAAFEPARFFDRLAERGIAVSRA
jgi:lysine 6-dehydrogenase